MRRGGGVVVLILELMHSNILFSLGWIYFPDGVGCILIAYYSYVVYAFSKCRKHIKLFSI